jgi:hypothetical protein
MDFYATNYESGKPINALENLQGSSHRSVMMPFPKDLNSVSNSSMFAKHKFAPAEKSSFLE